ncbi:MAG: class D sortase [Anaerolineae bacterium]|nr:class D sortase [Anaerolineae bacterium]
MSERRPAEELSVEDLEQMLYRKKRVQRQQRLQRLKQQGRVVDVAGLQPPAPGPPTLQRPQVAPGGALRRLTLNGTGPAETSATAGTEEPARGIAWRWVANKFLLLIEIGVVAGLVWALLSLLQTRQELNNELAAVQKEEVAAVALPTPTATPVIDLVVLPGGHKPPVAGRPPEPGEAGYIPAHLLPAVSNYEPPPMPTPGPEQARRIQIPAINVDSSIYQGQEWEQLRKGVGQYLGSPPPGREGNLVLAAHNDIYGEIFRDLDQLSPGDEIIISTERQRYVYVVRKTEIVEPTDIWVMASIEYPSTTLISCYPYMIDNKRIVIFADLADTTS